MSDQPGGDHQLARGARRARTDPRREGVILMRTLQLLAINIVLATFLSFTITGASAQQPPSQSAASVAAAQQQVRDAEASRLKAFLDHDVKTMAALLADEMILVTSNGTARNKTQFMDDFVNRPTAFSEFVTDDMEVLVFGDVAITRGRYHNLVAQRSYAAPLKYALFLRVWVKRNGSWQLLSHQATAANQSTK
jgi:ketosteroid isomerase-like protein